MKRPEDVLILIVDDEPDLCSILAFDLEEAGFKTITAHNGQEALEALDRQAANGGIDIVISDIRMPKMDGMQLLAAVKRRNVETPVLLFISGFADLGVEEAYDLGAEALFSKPVRPEALIEVCKAALLPRDLRWARKDDRYAVKCSVEVQLPGYAMAQQARTMNLGRGGMFLCLKDPKLAVGDVLGFRLVFDDPQWGSVAGEGIIRWSRRAAQGDLPHGFGVEFLSLEQPGRKAIVTLLNAIKVRAFIPKT